MNITYNFNQDHDEAPNPPFPSKKVLQVKKRWRYHMMVINCQDCKKCLITEKAAKNARNCKLSLFSLSSLQFIALFSVHCSHSTLVKKKRISCVLFAFIAFPRVLSSNTFHLILWYRIKVHSCSYLSPSHTNSLRFDMHKLLSKVHQPKLKPFKETHTLLKIAYSMPRKA